MSFQILIKYSAASGPRPLLYPIGPMAGECLKRTRERSGCVVQLSLVCPRHSVLHAANAH